MTLKVYIGTEDDQFIPQKVLEYSIHKHSNNNVETIPVKQEMERVGGTNFGFVRFLIPNMNNYEGRAIYIDADQLVFEDINNLSVLLDDAYSVALVNQPEGNFGKKIVEQANQTSVMVLDCHKLKDWDPEIIFNNVVPNKTELEEGQIHYRDFMMLKWYDQNKIQHIDPRWNHFNIKNPDTKLTHFSHVRTQPWKKPDHPLTEYWAEWLVEAIKNNSVTKNELEEEVKKGHIHPDILSLVN